jgi:hypothetical protein
VTPWCPLGTQRQAKRLRFTRRANGGNGTIHGILLILDPYCRLMRALKFTMPSRADLGGSVLWEKTTRDAVTAAADEAAHTLKNAKATSYSLTYPSGEGEMAETQVISTAYC